MDCCGFVFNWLCNCHFLCWGFNLNLNWVFWFGCLRSRSEDNIWFFFSFFWLSFRIISSIISWLLSKNSPWVESWPYLRSEGLRIPSRLRSKSFNNWSSMGELFNYWGSLGEMFINGSLFYNRSSRSNSFDYLWSNSLDNWSMMRSNSFNSFNNWSSSNLSRGFPYPLWSG